MKLTAEFTTEPFEEEEGEPPTHALAPRDHRQEAGWESDFGPLGTSISGDHDTLLPAVASVLHTALDSRAHRITLQVTVDNENEA